MDKPYGLGLLVGRFQTLHLGHVQMIRTALTLCREVGVFVGSSQESGTSKNPFSYELRKEMLTRVFGEDIRVCPLPDIGVGNNAKWGAYVLQQVRRHFGKYPDLVISAREDRRASWYDCPEGAELAELILPRKIPVSATQMRRYFLLDDRAAWEKHTDEKLRDMYPHLREIVLKAQVNSDTQSL